MARTQGRVYKAWFPYTPCTCTMDQALSRTYPRHVSGTGLNSTPVEVTMVTNDSTYNCLTVEPY